MTAVHQFLPTFAGRDAIGMHCQRLRSILQEAGITSEIYADQSHSDVEHIARPARSFAASSVARDPDTWILYHFSVGSSLVDYVETLGVPVAIDYHNVTEARYFLRWEPAAASIMYEGRRQLGTLVPATRFAVADSSYNRAELDTLGFAPTAVAPILIDFSLYDAVPDAARLERRQAVRQRGGTDWLYVGRVAPNKCQHDVIAAFAVYRKVFDPRARLTLVGGNSAIRYTRALERLCADLGIADAVDFTDVVTHEELLACYRSADVFVCLSEHEGFNVPVLEAMYFDVPVVALASSAVPETVGDGGVLLDTKDPVLVAATVDQVVRDATLRSAVTTAGAARVKHFALEETGPHMLATLTRLMEETR